MGNTQNTGKNKSQTATATATATPVINNPKMSTTIPSTNIPSTISSTITLGAGCYWGTEK